MAILNLDYCKTTDCLGISEEESAIARYIFRNAPNEDYNELIKNDDSYFVKFHFSDFRQSALRWYPFKKESSVLEVNTGYGALTGALCDACPEVVCVTDTALQARCIYDRYSSRNNLTVFAGNIEDISFNKKFDYIVCFRKLEESDNPTGYLNYLKSLLCKNGVLLICVENQYGIQYLAGKKETYSGIPFESIAGYNNRRSFRGYNHAELERIIKNSSFSCWKFYYPFPDYVAARAIFTDEGQPEANMRERLCVLHDDVSSYISNDAHLFMDAIDNGVYPFLSNHFLVELTDNREKITDILYMTLSAGYRERKHAFAVMIRNNGTVQKKCLYREAEPYARELCSIADRLSARGVHVLPMSFEEGSLYMDFVRLQTVQLYIRQLVTGRGNKDKIISVFDKIWEDILRSSEESNVCSKDTEGIDVGPILRTAYIEMVTINSFWDNGNIIYFDQEYVRENYPAKYVLNRSINMVFGNIPQTESIVKKEEVLNRFGITEEMCKLFNKFNTELYKMENPYQDSFYTLQVNTKKALENRKKLLGELQNGR